MATLPPSVIFGPTGTGAMGLLDAPPLGNAIAQPDPVEIAAEILSGTLMSRVGTFSTVRNPTDLVKTRTAGRTFQRSRCFALGSSVDWIVDANMTWTLAVGVQSSVLPNVWLSRLDRAIRELGRLKAGWDGPGSQPLSHAFLVQIEGALAVLPGDTREPELEVDGSDCSVTARWWTPDGQSAFAMTFTGQGKVHGVTSSTSVSPPSAWHCETDEETKILDRIDHPLIRQALTGNL